MTCRGSCARWSPGRLGDRPGHGGGTGRRGSRRRRAGRAVPPDGTLPEGCWPCRRMSPTTRPCVAPSPMRRRLGGLDVLVNNAGIGAQGAVEDNADDEWLRVLDVNVIGTARMSRAAWPHLVASSRAAIVNTARSRRRPGYPSGPSTQPARERCSRSPGQWPPMASPKGSASTPSIPGRRTRRGSGGCWPLRPTPMRNGTPSRPASPTAGWSRPPRSPARCSTWPHPDPGLQRAQNSRSTAECRACGSGRGPDAPASDGDRPDARSTRLRGGPTGGGGAGGRGYHPPSPWSRSQRSGRRAQASPAGSSQRARTAAAGAAGESGCHLGVRRHASPAAGADAASHPGGVGRDHRAR